MRIDPRIGLASPLVREEEDHSAIQFACGLFDLTTPTYQPTYTIEQAREWQTKYPDRIALVGTAMLVRRAVFEKIGVLDDRIFAYWEDIDYRSEVPLRDFSMSWSSKLRFSIRRNRQLRPRTM